MNKYILKFERKLFYKNYSAIFFGLIFPILLTILIIYGVIKDVPKAYINDAKTSILLTINLISPISIFMIGLASSFSKDLEEGVYDRLDLFSINHLKMAKSKLLVYFVFRIICNLIYFPFLIRLFDIDIETISIFKHLSYVILISISMFLISYSICLITKKFSVAFPISMGIYFAIMIFGGMMGIQVDDLPDGLKTFAKALPTSHFSSPDYLTEIAKGGQMSYVFLQKILVLLMLSIILFVFSVNKNKRKVN